MEGLSELDWSYCVDDQCGYGVGVSSVGLVVWFWVGWAVYSGGVVSVGYTDEEKLFMSENIIGVVFRWT